VVRHNAYTIIIIIENVLIRLTLNNNKSVAGALYTVNAETLQKLRN